MVLLRLEEASWILVDFALEQNKRGFAFPLWKRAVGSEVGLAVAIFRRVENQVKTMQLDAAIQYSPG